MRTCSITGIPFYQSVQAVVIPVLVRKTYSDCLVANENVLPFPIAVAGEFSEEFYIGDKKRGKVMMNMISSVLGYKLSWEDFENLRGDEKEVSFDGKDFIIGFFACHKNVYDSIMKDFRCNPHFNLSKEEVNFDDFNTAFKTYVEKNDFRKLLTSSTMSFKDSLGSIRGDFAIPDSFSESEISYFSEIQFIHRFLSLIGKRWELSGIAAYEEDSELALKIYKESISSHF